jgi:hypothetical protein
MTNKLALATATAVWFGLAGFAIAADEAPGAHSDITIVQSTPGEKGDPATSAPPAASDDRNVNNKKDNEGSEGSSNKE